MNRTARMTACAAMVLRSVLASPAVRAEPNPSQEAAAEALFEQARTSMQAGEFAPACEKLEASQKLASGIGTLLYLGDCFEAIGRTASAWARFREAESLARAAGQDERARIAEIRALALEPRLCRLTLDVPASARVVGLEVRRAGTLVPPPAWGVATPVDPGAVEVEAVAAGKRPWRRTVELDDEHCPVTMTVPPLEDVAKPTSTFPTARSAGRTTDAVTPPTSQAARIGTAAGFLGGAVAALGVGTAFGWRAKQRNDASLEECRAKTLCSDRGLTLRNDARKSARISTASFVAGGVLGAAGIVSWVAMAPPERPDADRPRGAMLHVRGRW